LALPSGSVAWMPSFHCGVEVQTALDAGLGVQFYRVAPDLSIDEQDLEKKLCNQPGPVLAVHYFGLAQPAIAQIAALCRKLGVTLIEDCAQALFSRQGVDTLGEIAPMAVFSLRKSLPVLEGGVLRIDLASVPVFDPPPYGSFALAPYNLYIKSIVNRVIGERATAFYRRCRFGTKSADIAKRSGQLVAPSLLPDRYEDRMSWLTYQIATAAKVDFIVQRRRSNWASLKQRLAEMPGYRPVFRRLPTGACPLFLPIYVADRPRFIMDVENRGIEIFAFGAYSHPALDKRAFPETSLMRNTMVCLPIQQELGEREMDIIANAVLPSLRAP